VASVDVVVVSFNSRDRLRGCVEPLAGLEDIHVAVVDNASTDASLDAVGDLPVTRIALETNGGFAHGCNTGWRQGDAPAVLFLNPDARIEPDSVRSLARVLERHPEAGAVGPKIFTSEGALDFSQRLFPPLASTFAEALFLHRLFPRAEWIDGTVRDLRAYAQPSMPDWISGACMLVRRSALEALGGLDESFFLYCEDMDLCRRLRNAGFTVRFEPSAVAYHEGGASAPRPVTVPLLAASRLRYADKHLGRAARVLDRAGLIARALTHVVVSRGGLPVRAAHARALRLLVSPSVGKRSVRTA
jgi:N-acetylglucosaminyl-diphospho-decaprenol L-rhamnosyltransferase